MRVLACALALCALTGCSQQVISREALLLTDQTAPFAAVRENPAAHGGRHLLVGGAVARISNTPEGAELEVVQFPLGSSDRPDEKKGSEGRFLARSREFLDPLIYKPGRMVTLVGKVTGEAIRPLDGVDYRYPVLEVREIHPWKPEDPYSPPPFHFGIGVGIGL